MKINRMPIAFWASIVILTCSLISSASIYTVIAQTPYQTWKMTATTEGGSYTGTLNVQSNGDFASSGFTGSTPSGSYPISVEGFMSGTMVSLTLTASYDNGNGQINGYGEGTLNANFPSATSASGTISGTISDPLGARSFSMSWTATKTSGGSGGGGGGGLGLFDDDSRGIVPYVVAAVVGVVLISVIVTVTKYASASSKARRQQRMQASMGPMHNRAPPQMRETRPVNYQYGQPNPQGFQGSMIPPPIGMDNGTPITGQGASVVSPGLGTLPFLNGVWEPGKATLTWGTPQFDQTKYALLGYDISQQTFGPTSTAAQNTLLGRAPASSNSTVIQPFNQTYRWNTAGDIGGFRVDPVFGELNPQGQVINQFHYGGLEIRVGQPFGTFGAGL